LQQSLYRNAIKDMLNNTTDFEQITMHRTERTVELEAENGCISGAEAIQS